MVERTRRRTFPAFVLTLAALVVMMWPYAAVLQTQVWVLSVLPALLVVTVAGSVVRALPFARSSLVGDLVAVPVQLLGMVAVLTAQFGQSTGILGVIPTAQTAELVPRYLSATVESIWLGSAPLQPDEPLLFVLAAAFALVAVLLNQQIARGAGVLPALAVGAVGAVPAMITRGAIDVIWFVLFALLLFVLLRRSAAVEPRSPRPAPLAATAVVGTIAVVGSLFFAPEIPLASARFGVTPQLYLNPTLQLGEDLRQPDSFPVIVLATAERRAPYLRIATLSSFTGSVWESDDYDTITLDAGFPTPSLPVDAEEYTASIRVQDVIGRSLPTPYPAVGMNGLSSQWRLMPANGTIVSSEASTAAQDYTITALRVVPDLEQIRHDRAGDPGDPVFRENGHQIPDAVTRLAREVTAGAMTDYDRLLALQSWFRSDFRYSLEAPVEQGFDGSGVEAVERFLEVREGYCVHFASAFALMARALGMSARIVVGFLPGTPTGQRRGEESLFSVTSDDLHAWPEVYFEQWGWIPFEPTASLGTPTAFAPPQSDDDPDVGESTPGPTTAPDEVEIPGLVPSDEPTITPDAAPDPEDDQPGVDLRPAILVLLAVALLALLPAALRLARRGRRLFRAARGDAEAAWTELEDTLVDLRMPVTDAETPRGRGIRLSGEHAITGTELAQLVGAIEAARYAPPGGEAQNLAPPLRRVIRRALATASPRRRALSLWLPRSLLPGRVREPVRSVL